MVKSSTRYRVRKTIRAIRVSKERLEIVEKNIFNNQKHKNSRYIGDCNREIEKHENHLIYLFKNRHLL